MIRHGVMSATKWKASQYSSIIDYDTAHDDTVRMRTNMLTTDGPSNVVEWNLRKRSTCSWENHKLADKLARGGDMDSYEDFEYSYYWRRSIRIYITLEVINLGLSYNCAIAGSFTKKSLSCAASRGWYALTSLWKLKKPGFWRYRLP